MKAFGDKDGRSGSTDRVEGEREVLFERSRRWSAHLFGPTWLGEDDGEIRSEDEH